jgi:hypothetical protein
MWYGRIAYPSRSVIISLTYRSSLARIRYQTVKGQALRHRRTCG